MTIHQLKKTKRAIEAFFYKVRFNVGLHQALKGALYNNLRSQIKSAIQKQILFFAKVEKVNYVVGVQKAVRNLSATDLLDKIAYYWIPLLGLIDDNSFTEYVKSLATAGGQAGLNKLESEAIFALNDSSLLSTLEKRAVIASREIDITTQDWIARTIEEGFKKGLSSIEIAQLLHTNADHASSNRADAIVEYEGVLAYDTTEQELYRKNGVKHIKWVTSHDELTCIDCIANEEAGSIPSDGVFPGGVGQPPQHQRCRCIIVPVDKVNVVWAG